MSNRIDWDQYFMAMAKMVSLRSTCNSRPTGAVLVEDRRILATGYNGVVPGYKHCTDGGDKFCFRRSVVISTEEDKYNYCRSIHAEANVVSQAALKGVSIKGSTLYTTLAPCYICIKLLYTSGVKNVYYELDYVSGNEERDDFWKGKAKQYFVKYRQLSVSEDTVKKILQYLEPDTSRRRL